MSYGSFYDCHVTSKFNGRYRHFGLKKPVLRSECFHHILQRASVAWPVSVSRYASFGEYSIINSTFSGFEETPSYWSVQFFSVFIDHH